MSSQEDHDMLLIDFQKLLKPYLLIIKDLLKIGDTLLVHHNVFKFYYDMYGREKSGRSFLKENLFLVDN